MEDEHREILMGIIILFLIVDTITIFSIVPASNLQSSSPALVPAVEIPAPVLMVNTAPPPVVSTTTDMVKTAVIPPIPVPGSNLQSSSPTLVTAVEIPITIPARPGYVNIYKIHESELINDKIPPVLFNLLNPPLIIDFDVTAINITDEKYFEYKVMSTVHQETVDIIRPYENAKFLIQVIDNNSSRVVTEDGYGGEYGLQSPKKLTVMERGNYSIRLSGMYVNVSLSIEVPNEMNVP